MLTFKKTPYFNRAERYYLKAPQAIPLRIVVRDFLFTLLAWGIALWLCWDFLMVVSFGILHEFDSNPLNDFDWESFSKQLRVSFLFSSSVLIFLISWFIANILILRRTSKSANIQTPPLTLEKEVTAYGCTVKEVKEWRNYKILKMSVDDKGQVLKVDCL